MKSILKYFVFSFCLALFDAKEDRHVFRCDYTYFPDAGGWLKLHEIPSNWPDARMTCHLEGGVLASPVTNEIRAAMMTLKGKIMNTTASTPNTPISVHTGIHSNYVRTSFASIEGVPLTHINHKWAKGSPYSDCGDASSLVMGPDGSFYGVDGAEQQLPYICYKQYAKFRMNDCGTVDDDYFLDQKTGSCYKFHQVARTWLDAYMTCTLEGAHLVVINSKDEAELVANIINKNTNTESEEKHRGFKGSRNDMDMYVESGEYENMNMEVAQDAVVHIGYSRSKNSRWLPLTIHGQTLREAGYSKIGKKNQGYMCGALDDKAYLITTSCSHMYYRFVCEKAPKSKPCGEDK